MSYSRMDRFGELTTSYAPTAAGSGERTWWPDFGPSTQDFSQQRRSHPSDMIYEKIMEPKSWSTQERPRVPQGPASGAQFRNPAPARQALLETGTSADRKLAAHVTTERQLGLRRLEMRQRRVDSWAGTAPVHVSPYLPGSGSGTAPLEPLGSLLGSQSEPSLGLSTLAASSVSRDVYERHGYLVGRSQGSIADGRSGGGDTRRRHNPLSLQSMLMPKDSGSLRSSSTTTRVRMGPRKPGGQWRACPESRYIFDPRTFLPVPRGGWDSHELSLAEWPDVAAAGDREFHDKDPVGSLASA